MRKATVILLILSALVISWIGKISVTTSMEKSTTKKLAASADRIYVLDRENRLVRILDASGNETHQFEIVTYYSRAMPDLVDIAFYQETLYVLDTEFSEIWCYSPDGKFTHNLPPVRKYLQSPSALYVDSRGLLIADTGCVWVTDPLGHVLDRIVLPPDANGMPAVVTDITMENDQVYLADATASRIMIVNGAKSWEFGEGKVLGGLGYETGRFMYLSGITCHGNLYATDAFTGKITSIHAITGQPSLLPQTNQAFHPTDILFWKDQLWVADQNSEKLWKMETGLKPATSRSALSVNVLDFGTWSENTLIGTSFRVWSVDGSPISGKIASSNPIFKLDKTAFKGETDFLVVVSPDLSKIKEGTRETGTISIHLDTGDVQTLEVRARKKKSDPDFQLLYQPYDADLVGKGYELPIQCKKHDDVTMNLEFSFGASMIPFDFSWDLKSMAFVNFEMTNKIILKPLRQAVSGFYSLPIIVKCPEVKLVKQLTITFFYRGMTGKVPGTILGEYFAADWCEFCPSGHMALPELHQKYTQDDIVFMTYYNDCMEATPERLCFSEGETRMKWYAPVGLHVALILNGTTIKEGGYNDGVTTMTKEYDELIKGLSPMKSSVSLSGSAHWEEGTRTLNVGATLECLQDIPWKNPRLYCVLVENDIAFNAKNGVKEHNYVIRDFLSLPNPEENEAYGSPIWGRDGEILSKVNDQWQGHMETTVEPLVKMENAFCILFVQDNETKQVYQARYIPLHENRESLMQWVPERKLVRLPIDQTARVKTWLVNRGNLIDTFTLDVFNHKPFFGEDTWFVGGNEYAINQEISVTLNPMESVLVEVPISPIWGKPEMPGLDLKATDSAGKEKYCQIRIQGTEHQPRFELLYPDASLLEESKGWQTDLISFNCILRTEPGTVIFKDETIKAGSDGLMVIPIAGKGECFGKNRRSMTLQYPDSSFESLTFFYDRTMVLKLTIGSKVIQINRTYIDYEAAPFISNSRTMVPIRIITESLFCGAHVAWDGSTQKVTISTEALKVEIQVGRLYALVNGKQVPLDAPPVNKNGRVFLPLRFFAETLGAKVEWDASTQTVTITS